MYNFYFPSSNKHSSKGLYHNMGTWYKNSRFLRKLGQFQEVDHTRPDWWQTGDFSAEYALWKILQNRQLNGFKFERRQWILGNIVSFYCRKAKLAVDLEHIGHKIRQKEEQDSDKLLQKAGIKVLRFHRDVILERPNSVKNSILEELPEIKLVT